MQGFDGKARLKKTTGKNRSWWDDNIEMHLREI
jgi:hypothetical protein